MPRKQNSQVLIPFNVGPIVYGMERGVIEVFDLLRPELEPHFLMSFTTGRLRLPILQEIQARGLNYSFFSDKTAWPRIGKPKSLPDVWRMASAIIRGNRDVYKAAKDKDVIYIPGVNYFFWSAIAIIRQRLLRRRVAYQFHDLLIRPSLSLRLTSLFVTDFIHCSRLGFNLVSEGNPYIRKRRNHILPYRTGSPRLTSQSIAVNGDFEGRVNLLFFGQVSRHKGVDILLEAFEQVASEFPNTILHIAGGYSNTEFETACTEFMAKEHLRQRIKYWGFVEDIEQLLKLANIHVHPSPPSRFMDTFPLAALESMRHGVPTVCFESGGLPEMIVDGETGVICRDESVEGLVDGIRKLLSRPQLINLYSLQAANRYQELYSEEPVKRAWLEAFSEKSPE